MDSAITTSIRQILFESKTFKVRYNRHVFCFAYLTCKGYVVPGFSLGYPYPQEPQIPGRHSFYQIPRFSQSFQS